MKEPTIDRQRTVVAHGQTSVVAQPRKGALNDPASLVSPQGSAVLRGRLASPFTMRNDQLDAAPSELLAQRIAVVAAVGDHPLRLLSRPAGMMPSPHSDRRERRLREFDFRRGCRVKVVSQRNTLLRPAQEMTC